MPLEMITSGENVDARAALTMGLASDVVPADKLLDAAIGVIRAEQAERASISHDRERWTQPIDSRTDRAGFPRRDGLGHDPAGDEGQLSGAAGGAGADARNVPAAGRRGPASAKPKAWPQLFGSPVNAALINVFFLTDRNKHDTGLDKSGVQPRHDQDRSASSAAASWAGHRRRRR